MKKIGEVLTFYSYKGGTGRSMAMAHVAWVLACRGARVLAVDWDLEAPGLHRYFAPFLDDPQAVKQGGLIDFLLHYCDGAATPDADTEAQSGSTDWIAPYTELWRYAQKVDLPGIPESGRLDFVSAGRQDELYGDKVSLFDWRHFYTELGGGAFLNRTRDACVSTTNQESSTGLSATRARYDYLLIDSRTGLSDTSGICTAQLPDKLICLFTYNVQSLEGASQVARSAVLARQEMRRAAEARHSDVSSTSALGELLVFPVGARRDDSEPARLDNMRSIAQSRFGEFIWHIPRARQSSYWVEVELPYKFALSYNEALATIDLADDEQSYLAAAHRLTEVITSNTGPYPRLSLERDVARQTWDRYSSILSHASGTRPTQSEAGPRNFEAILADALNREGLANGSRIKVIFQRLADLRSNGAENYCARRIALSELQPEQRKEALRLVGDGLLSIEFDATGAERTIGVVDEVAFQVSSQVNLWITESATVIASARALGEIYSSWLIAGKKPSPESVGQLLAFCNEHSSSISPVLSPHARAALQMLSHSREVETNYDQATAQLTARDSANREQIEQLTARFVQDLRNSRRRFFGTAGTAAVLLALCAGLTVFSLTTRDELSNTKEELKVQREVAVKSQKRAQELEGGRAEVERANSESLKNFAELQAELSSTKDLLTSANKALAYKLKTDEELRRAAADASRRGDLDVSGAFMGAISSLNLPDSVKVADQKLMQKKYLDAAKEYEKILKIEPFSVPALLGMAKSMRGLSKTAAAAEYFQKAYAFATSTDPLKVEAGSFIALPEFGSAKPSKGESVRIVLPPLSPSSEVAGKSLAWALAKRFLDSGFSIESIQSTARPFAEDVARRGISIKSYKADDKIAADNAELVRDTNRYMSERIPGMPEAGSLPLPKSSMHEVWISDKAIALLGSANSKQGPSQAPQPDGLKKR